MATKYWSTKVEDCTGNELRSLATLKKIEKLGSDKLPRFTGRMSRCTRCGGTGIYSQWHGECYECGGAGVSPRSKMEYTCVSKELHPEFVAMAQKHLDSVHAATERREAKRRIELDAKIAEDERKLEALGKEHPSLARALELEEELRGLVRAIIDTVKERCEISEKQLAVIDSALNRYDWQKEDEKAQAEKLAQAPTLEAGRRELRGVILGTKEVDAFRGDGTDLKLLIELEDGNKVFGSIASGFRDGAKYDDEGVRVWRNAIVEFTATIDPKEEHFGFYKRPTKASIVGYREVS